MLLLQQMSDYQVVGGHCVVGDHRLADGNEVFAVEKLLQIKYLSERGVHTE